MILKIKITDENEEKLKKISDIIEYTINKFDIQYELILED